ncbi:hypothetical protein BC835DRAFT_405956 [Cytidiella melzeri]|nr:hypothetical protein BC835DRAFT_405956 [Cytidiella melzeri]
MTLNAVMRVADAEHRNDYQDTTVEVNLENEFKRLRNALDRVHAEKAGKCLEDKLLSAMKHLGTLCSILEARKDVPFCNVVAAFLKTARAGLMKMIQNRKEVDADILSLIESLLVAVGNASHYGSAAVKAEAVHLAAECAELFDIWIYTGLGIQLLKSTIGSAHERVRTFHERVTELARHGVHAQSEHRHERCPSSESFNFPLTPPSEHYADGSVVFRQNSRQEIDGEFEDKTVSGHALSKHGFFPPPFCHCLGGF